MATPELCRKHGVSRQTFYRWKPNVRKGSKLYIEGKLQTSTWEDKQSGERKYRTEIVARDIVLLGSRDSGEERRLETLGAESKTSRLFQQSRTPTSLSKLIVVRMTPR